MPQDLTSSAEPHRIWPNEPGYVKQLILRLAYVAFIAGVLVAILCPESYLLPAIAIMVLGLAGGSTQNLVQLRQKHEPSTRFWTFVFLDLVIGLGVIGKLIGQVVLQRVDPAAGLTPTLWWSLVALGVAMYFIGWGTSWLELKAETD